MVGRLVGCLWPVSWPPPLALSISGSSNTCQAVCVYCCVPVNTAPVKGIFSLGAKTRECGESKTKGILACHSITLVMVLIVVDVTA